MPYTSEWVPPEIFLTHKDVTVYHSYKDNDLSNGRARYWYTMSQQEEQDHEFDVRELATWNPLLKKLLKKIKRPKLLTVEEFPVLGTLRDGDNIMDTKDNPKFKAYWKEHEKWQKYQEIMASAELVIIKKAIRQAIDQKILKQA
jgi:hypothetical protein